MTIESAGSPPAQPVAPAAPSKSVFQRIAGVFFAPNETFQDIARKPDILWPLLIIIIVGYVTTFVMMPRMDFDTMLAQQAEQMKEKQPNMSDADIERIGRLGRASMKVMQFAGPLIAVVWYLLMAVVLWGAVRIMGGEGTFPQSLSATLYSWMPLLLFSIILAIIAVAQGSIDPAQMATIVKSNPAAFMDAKEQPVLASFLSSFDIFTIWTVVLLILGFSALSRLSKGKTAAIVLGLWFVMIGIKVGFAALGAMGAQG